MTHCIVLDRLFLHRHWIFRIFIIDCHLVISLQFKTDIARESRAISVFTCSDITRDRCPLYQIVKDTSKIDNGYQLFQPAFGYKWWKINHKPTVSSGNQHKPQQSPQVSSLGCYTLGTDGQTHTHSASVRAKTIVWAMRFCQRWSGLKLY